MVSERKLSLNKRLGITTILGLILIIIILCQFMSSIFCSFLEPVCIGMFSDIIYVSSGAVIGAAVNGKEEKTEIKPGYKHTCGAGAAVYAAPVL